MKHAISRFGSILALACAGAAAVSCRNTLPPTAEKDMGCGPGRVATTQAGFWGRAAGCGKDYVYWYDASQDKWVSALDRAAFDLSCPKAQLSMIMLTGQQAAVSGCGKKAVYLGHVERGWIMNSVSEAR